MTPLEDVGRPEWPKGPKIDGTRPCGKSCYFDREPPTKLVDMNPPWNVDVHQSVPNIHAHLGC